MTDWQQLRARYVQNLPTAREAIRSALELLETAPAEAEGSLRRIAHQLRGSGASFGYPAVTEAAADLETAGREELAHFAQVLLRVTEEITEGREGGWEVVVVEDDPVSAELSRGVLEQLPARVRIASSAGEGLEMVRSRPPHLLLLDLVLPDRDGRSVLMELQRDPELSDIPVLVLSAKEASAVRAECLLLGAREFIEKPLDPERLLRSARTLLADLVARRNLDVDSLTGLPTRATLISRLQAAAAKRPYWLALLDVDHLSRINRDHGREAGSRLLRELAALLEQAVRPGELIGRWEGDNGLLAIPVQEREAAVQRIEELRVRVRQRVFEPVEGAEARITISAGMALLPSPELLEEKVGLARQRLFLAKSRGRDRVVADDETASSRRGRILIADDDEMVAALVRHRLQRSGLDVEHVDNGRDAVERGEREEYDLIILDVKMPVFDGFEVIRRLRSEAKITTPIILFTSMGSERDVVRGFELGADDYVTKPFSPAELTARVLHHLRRRV